MINRTSALLCLIAFIWSPTLAAAQHTDAPASSPIIVIAHRGSGLTPTSGTKLIGNTFNAIQQGIDHGADWIEIDIRQSRDGTLMVFHDATVDRATNATGAVDTYTADELQALQLNVTPTETIPTLESVFKRFASTEIRFILDIKVQGIRTELVMLTAQYLQHDQAILFGDTSILKEYIDCPYSLGYTARYSEGSNRYRFWLGHSFLLDRCEKLGSHTLVLPRVFLKESLIQSATKSGITVWSYGDDSETAWTQATKAGVTGLIVDDVERAQKALFENQ